MTDYWHFPTFLLSSPAIWRLARAANILFEVEGKFSHCFQKTHQPSYWHTKLPNYEEGGKKIKRVGRGAPTQRFLHIAHLSHSPWGSPVRSPGFQTTATPSIYRAWIVVERISRSFKVIRHHYQKPWWLCCDEVTFVSPVCRLDTNVCTLKTEKKFHNLMVWT